MMRFENAQLGFGAARLPGGLTRADCVRLFETALDAGVAHFDVARMYGDGAAEGLLGEVAQRRRSEMIIVTKCGISPASNSLAARATRRVFGATQSGLGRSLADAVGPKFGRFSARQVRDSLDTSLAALRTDHVDALLLHECEPAHITDELKRALEDLVAQGKARRIGLATGERDTAAICAKHPELGAITQLHVHHAAAAPSNAKVIFHSVLGPRLSRLRRAMERDPALREKAALSGIDPTALAGLLLRDCLSQRPGATVLFASHSASHIEANAATPVEPLSAAQSGFLREVEASASRSAEPHSEMR